MLFSDSIAEELSEETDDDAADVLLGMIDYIQHRIAVTPAFTPRGCAVQVRLALREYEQGAAMTDNAVIGLRQAADALDAMPSRTA